MTPKQAENSALLRPLQMPLMQVFQGAGPNPNMPDDGAANP